MTPKFEKAIYPINKRKIADSKQILILAKDTGRVLLAKRPSEFEDEGVWGMWQNVTQETGYNGNVLLIKKSQMKYNIGRYNFISVLGVVPQEFTPSIGEGIKGYMWAFTDQLNSLKLHRNVEVYVKAIQKSLEKYYKDFINEHGQGGDVYIGSLPHTVS